MGLKKGPPPNAEKDRSERWLLTYADLITLLLIFFIVLYSMSKIDSKRFEEMSKSLAIAFGGAGRSGVLDAGRSVIPGDKVYKERLEMQSTEERVRRMIAQRGLEGKISTDLGQRGLVISVKDTVLFTVGSADLTPAAREVMKNVTTIMSAMPNPIRIEGHSDTVPIHTERFYSNWELSTARATNVLQFFIKDGGIAPERLSAAGYGEYRPLVPNSNDRNRALNRRVDIVLLSSAYSKFEPGGLLEEGIKPAAPFLAPPVGDTAAAALMRPDSGTMK
jgi:chemotaxis protein MotB